MTKIYLTSPMERTLSKLLKLQKGECAYVLRESMSTLVALCRLKLATSHEGLGSLFSPRTSVEYKITDVGRAWFDKTNKVTEK